MQNEENLESRRPLKVRGNQLAKNFAKWLSEKSITPNQISILSIFFALCSAACFVFSVIQIDYRPLWMILAALFIQARLLCNLFDGMVAIEGGKSTASGELFNDIPDRISDPLIIIAAGYSILCVTWGDSLGWLAALLAVLTAYVRILAVAIGAPSNFTGPMAKQQRMALLTVSCVLVAIEQYFWQHDYVMLIALIIMNLGCIWTLIRRSTMAYQYLEKTHSS
ncbi:CDP-alcohol phosphatidyltransferase family protein [Acinetobacter gerneri]|uniref:CDP-alcohol phosphatidyltransferase family protein n=1 Tax=Acinetobacter gerneri TaxID=202952 RepID=A0AAW8JKI4_9GAMM|nr:CDP-alcohol phosphatidyltransferase family protein [Acinetobacter gerneri]MDQ9011351.1 CDP-alcohol phosphatidyltransferase family protein [Acinetobacter gerneri]MDQ9015487.1 CDP-alcohol phosphatidyltransferase family protein [Acinetobacter gerneri]MDQ9026682.1 CDP-alcohol phosphatidyltransferase family protein [Acinetobacter gerneri]MDQ9053963.1 CDP-alcohol phosphatidyltransferase family protein [Acinetobacter gerneri]MDQ9061633.1 CDP-alcohol phosphatidyltransferase family protein [Acinetob